MPLSTDKAWFPAKRYGWGWGFPCRWQGWVVFSGFIVGMVAVSPLVYNHPTWYGVAVGLLVVALIAICWWKGERPRWRWGGRE